MKTMGRVIWIDGLKGWTIFLVILGHVIQTLCTDFDNNHVFRYIYSFHMPLFMFLSGYFGILSPDIKKRARQLLIPFFAWAFISALFYSQSIKMLILNLLVSPDYGLWFLYSLFFIIVLFGLCANLFHRLKRIPFIVILGGNVILLYALAYLCSGRFGTGTLFWYFAFYSLGYLFRQNEGTYLFYMKKCFPILLLIFICAGYFWKRTLPLEFPFSNYRITSIIFLVYKFFTAIAGIFVFIYIYYRSRNILSKLYLNKLGEMTLGIYAIHSIYIKYLVSFLSVGFWNYIVLLGSVIVLSILSVLLLRKNKLTAMLLLGSSMAR